MNEIYAFTVPIFVRTLGGLKNVLGKAEAQAKESGMSEADLLDSRLAPDMYPLVKQVQIACDNAKRGVARLSGIEAPVYEDTEVSIAELQARIDKTVAFIESVPESAFAEASTRQVVLPFFPENYLTGFDYAREFALPNFFFHVVTAYGIVRKVGTPLEKSDYINGLSFHPL